MDLGLAGKACIVTGASSGIGLATTRMLLAEGARVLAVARNEERLAAAASGSVLGGAVGTLALDVTEADAGERMVAAADHLFGGVDVLVNGAGEVVLCQLEESTDDDWQRQWELNVMAPRRAMAAAIPSMLGRGWGRIVNISSTSGKRPSALNPAYSVAKAAELSLSRLYAERYAARGVLVNAVCPGLTRSEMWTAPGGLADQKAALQGVDRETVLGGLGADYPLGRAGEPAEVAAAVVFLCSGQASFMSGVALSVDGGAVSIII